MRLAWLLRWTRKNYELKGLRRHSGKIAISETNNERNIHVPLGSPRGHESIRLACMSTDCFFMMASFPSSRIFIKNLPSTLTLEDFRKHFSHQFPITDAKFLQHRRIGYVGYKTPEDAAKVVRYFHKSFMGMAKLSVELAKPVEEFDQRRKRRRVDGAGGEGEVEEERIRNSPRPKEDSEAHSGKRGDKAVAGGREGKLQEYLQVMQQRSKSKTWQNEDRVDVEDQACTESEIANNLLPESKIEDEYEPVPKKKKKVERQSEVDRSELPSPPNTPAEESHGDQGPVTTTTTAEPMKVDNPPPASDADWLRSRTSRLLGLIDNDDDTVQANLQKAEKSLLGEAGENQVSSLSDDREIAAVSQVYEDDKGTDATPEQEFPARERESILTGRLFIRNLTYTATEKDIRAYFESHGYRELEEVSFL